MMWNGMMNGGQSGMQPGMQPGMAALQPGMNYRQMVLNQLLGTQAQNGLSPGQSPPTQGNMLPAGVSTPQQMSGNIGSGLRNAIYLQNLMQAKNGAQNPALPPAGQNPQIPGGTDNSVRGFNATPPPAAANANSGASPGFKMQPISVLNHPGQTTMVPINSQYDKMFAPYIINGQYSYSPMGNLTEQNAVGATKMNNPDFTMNAQLYGALNNGLYQQ